VLLAGSLIEAAGHENQKQKYLSAICRGEAKATLALLEDSASWSLDAVQMKAAGLTLTGRKMFVPDAAVADFIVVAARLDGDQAVFIVPSKARGLRIAHLPAMDATRKLYEVSFDSVPAELVVQGGRAREALNYAIEVATVGLVAEMTGGMQRLLEKTVEYAKTRKQFGRAIGEFQAVQHQCADMLVYTESSRSAAYYAAYALQERIPEASLAVSVAKAYASDAYREVGNRAIQVHGGMGFTWENDAHLYYRRAKASEVAFGDAAFHRERIAKMVVDAGHAQASEQAVLAANERE